MVFGRYRMYTEENKVVCNSASVDRLLFIFTVIFLCLSFRHTGIIPKLGRNLLDTNIHI